jgi:signal transduction histidine kinase
MHHGLTCLPMERKRNTIKLLKEELNSRIEIQQRSLQTYSREIFDNVAQVLSLVKFQLSGLHGDGNAKQDKTSDPGKLLGKAIVDLRNLTKQLSPDEIIKKGFVASIHYELQRLSEAGFCKINLDVKGKPIILDEVKELVVFCILQQLAYPVLDIHDPGTINLKIHYRKGTIQSEIMREFKGELLFLNSGEFETLNQRLRTIQSSIGSKEVDKRLLQLTINI